jgi:hypothetical protein
VIYVSESGTEYCYTKAEKISGNYKNTSDGKLADSTQHTLTYGDYGNVQKNAEPVYWQSDSLAVSESSVDYYILTVKWDASFTNTKETDIIYITASRNVSD